MRALVVALLLAAGPAAAGDVLHDVEARLSHARVTRGRFQQHKQLVGIARPLEGSGTFLVDRERGVVWRSERPFETVLRITRREIMQSGGGEVLMRLSADSEPAVKTVSAVLFATFAADLAALSQFFVFEGDATDATWRLTLRPREPALARLIRRLDISGDRQVRRVQLMAASGDLLLIDFREVETAAAPTPGEAAEFD